VLRSALFWDITQRGVVFRYRRLGTTYLPLSRAKKCTDSWTSYVIAQMSADFVYVVAETWTHDFVLFKAGLDWPLGVQEVEAPRICRLPAQEGVKFVSPAHFKPLTSYFWYSLLLEVVSIPRPQCLFNQLRHHVPGVLGAERNTQTSDWNCLLSCLK